MQPAVSMPRRRGWRTAAAFAVCASLAGSFLVCMTNAEADAAARDWAALEAEYHALRESDMQCQCALSGLTPDQLAALERRFAEHRSRLQELEHLLHPRSP